ncbi:CG-1 domain-containing protein [Baffinella frigidus]|nr:CG-1 domain-containing protein [Cryptophyta sp. CCMP2293]
MAGVFAPDTFALPSISVSDPASQEPRDECVFADAPSVREVANKRWLKNKEVLDILNRAGALGFKPLEEVVTSPLSGQLILYDRSTVKHFRRDAHGWKKKRDGKTVREDHEKLKIDSVERLTCCYAHSAESVNIDSAGRLTCRYADFAEIPSFHRRIYWLLRNQPQPEPYHVLVHYLDERDICPEAAASAGRGVKGAAQKRTRKANGPPCQSRAGGAEADSQGQRVMLCLALKGGVAPREL